ncbi:hypothetical protein [Ruegeria arenilitoris]|uniref:hypothetical protein n=1 Tax=Ruegeria arenilitoris TaxID=1173585 RepID=UPI00147EBCE2|nr:hypothetical protein [Ruegeria arenilitoris]
MKNPFRSQAEQRAAAPAKPAKAGMTYKDLDMMARVIAKTMVPLQKRIAVLEKALEQEVQRSAATLSGDVDAFLDAGDLNPAEQRAMEATKTFHAKGGAE